jgi:hypothetical protein
LKYRPSNTKTYNWVNLNTLDNSMTLTTCLFFCITITTKNCKIKKPSAKVNLYNLINYSTINCWNGEGTTIVIATKFIYEFVLIGFGCPLALVSDQGIPLYQ